MKSPDTGAPGLAGSIGRRRLTRRQRARLTRGLVYAATLAALVWLALLIDWGRLQEAFFQVDIFTDLFPEIVTRAARNTLVFTALSFSIALVLGLSLALMRLSSIALYRWFAIGYIELFRGMPALLTIIAVGFASFPVWAQLFMK